MLAFFRNDMGFGGNNGLTDFKDLLGFDLQSDAVRVTLYLLTALSLVMVYLVCRLIVNSKFGLVLVAIRDAEDRTRFLGYQVEYFKLWIFVFSAVVAGIAGALYVPQGGIINPGQFSPLSLENRVAQTRLFVYRARCRFSNTLNCSNTVGFWNLRPIPACAISGSDKRSKSIFWPK